MSNKFGKRLVLHSEFVKDTSFSDVKKMILEAVDEGLDHAYIHDSTNIRDIKLKVYQSETSVSYTVDIVVENRRNWDEENTRF